MSCYLKGLLSLRGWRRGVEAALSGAVTGLSSSSLIGWDDHEWSGLTGSFWAFSRLLLVEELIRLRRPLEGRAEGAVEGAAGAELGRPVATIGGASNRNGRTRLIDIRSQRGGGGAAVLPCGKGSLLLERPGGRGGAVLGLPALWLRRRPRRPGDRGLLQHNTANTPLCKYSPIEGWRW